MRQKLLTIAFTALCLTKLYAQTYTEVEPNNSFAEANMVTAPVTIIDAMGTTNDVDFFRVNPASCGVLTITLSNVPADQFIRLYIYNSAQEQIGFAQPPSNGSGFTFDVLLSSGISYLKVFDYEANISSNAFNLALAWDDSDGCECNNSFATACLISPNTTIHPQIFGFNSELDGYDVDYFKLDLPSCGVVSVSLSELDINQFIRLYAYNENQTQIGFSQSPNDGTGFTYDFLLPAGISYFRILDYNSNSSSKQLNMTLTYDITDACECNNSFATACLISPNTTINPQIFGVNSDLGGDDVDYFKLDLPSCGVVSVNLSDLNTEQHIRLYAFNSAQSQIGFSQSPTAGTGFNYDFLLPAGISYLKILDYNGNSASNHLNMTLSYDNADACECNNSFATACLISPNATLYPQIFGVNSDLDGDDVDYFKVDLPSCGVVSVNLSDLDIDQFIRLYAFNANQEQIGFSQSPNNGTGFNFDFLLPTGISYLKILDYNGNSSSKQLTMTLTYDISDACECNNSFATACLVNAVDTLYPQIFGFNSDLDSYDVDYYEFQQSINCVSECFTISNVQPSQHLRLYVYDNLQTQIGFEQSPSNGTGFNYCLNLDIGTFYLKLFDYNATSTSGHITVVLSNTPSLAAPTITPSGYTLQSSVGVTYKWYLNGTLIEGETGQTITATQNGNYTVEITDENGCSNISAPYTVSGLSIAETELENLVSVFPNPAKDNFTISFPPTVKQIQISNSIGQVIQSRLVDREKQLNFEIAVDGIYFIQIKTDKQTITKKLTVCH